MENLMHAIIEEHCARPRDEDQNEPVHNEVAIHDYDWGFVPGGVGSLP